MGEVITRSYNIDEVCSLLADPRRKWGDVSSHDNDDHKNEWNLGATWEDSMNYLFNGWLDGVPKLSVEATSAIHEHRRPSVARGPVGSKVLMGRYSQGRPDCMSRVVRTYRPSPVVRIGVDRCASGSIAPDRIAAVGRSVLVVIESLRLAGIPAEVWACQAVTGRERPLVIYDLRICIQEASRAIDVSRLAYWVAHPSALRRTMFGLEESEPLAIRRRFGFAAGGHGYYYGMPHKNYARTDFEEWAPGAQSDDEELGRWTKEVIQRRARGGHQ